MSRQVRALLGALAILGLWSCGAANGQRGGEPERQLAEATVAVDVGKVKQLLASGADPNKMGLHNGHYQSPWKLAVIQIRPNRPGTAEIAQAMLKAGANPETAWGEIDSLRKGWVVRETTPIIEAVTWSATDVVRALMNAGLNRRKAELALEMAVESGHDDIVHVLVEAGVNVNSRATAITPLVAAIEARNVALMTYLEEHGAREKP